MIDLDKFKSEEKDRIFLADIKKFIQKNKYKLIKNNKNIEMVLKIDKETKNKKKKVKVAERFMMEKSKEKLLKIEEPEDVSIGSNIFGILDILESEV